MNKDFDLGSSSSSGTNLVISGTSTSVKCEHLLPVIQASMTSNKMNNQ